MLFAPPRTTRGASIPDQLRVRTKARVPSPSATGASPPAPTWSMASPSDGRSEASKLRKCARGSPDFYTAAAAARCRPSTAAALGSTYQRSEAPDGATSTFYIGALQLPARQPHNRRGQWSCRREHSTLQCGRAASRRLQVDAMCVESWRSRASILARGRLATIVTEEGHWCGPYGPLEGAARTHGS